MNSNKDPWINRSGGQPPDLEANLRKLFKWLTELFSIKPNGPDRRPPQGSFINRLGKSLWVILALFLLVWLLSGTLIVNPGEVAVITRLGRYVRKLEPGPHWVVRPFEKATLVNEQKVSTFSYEAEMLTKDENIVSVALAVQYRIQDAYHYLFSTTEPFQSLQQATASALRQVIGRTNLEQVLTTGRETVRAEVQNQIASILSSYQTGLVVTDVAMQPAKAPEEVKEAFDDAIKAQEDEQRFENQARAYAMKVELTAKGQAQRLLAAAQAYKQQAVLQAEGEVAGFLNLLPEYRKAPEITRKRLYLQTLEKIFSSNNKIFMDSVNNNLFYLPMPGSLTKDPSGLFPYVSSSSSHLASDAKSS